MIYYISIYFLISFLILILLSKIAYKFNLVDLPNKRKKHSKATAYTGGIALSFIYIISIFIFDVHIDKLNIILSIAFLIGIIGFLDDNMI